MPVERLDGRVAIVTGGGGRIGAATARRLASEGAKVIVADRSREAAESVARDIGDCALPFIFDAGEPESIRAMVETTVQRFGRIDILHNNAALLDVDFLNSDTDVVNISLPAWDKTMEVNVRGYVVACKHAIPHMRAVGGGVIINTSSNAALAGDSARIAYGASKAAINALTRHIATQHGRENIRCNAVSPGLITDPELEARFPDLHAVSARHTPLPRYGRGEDMAALVAFLASDDGSFITGQVICCDGGMLAHQPTYADIIENPSL
ncbi:short-chain dehydrogenase [Sphingobium baderi]|uniref:Short-chain dehydrogenase n=1 Tax=Sphingobium baderi TaxID=1332080 RepID=A0A0S3F3J2_9SPHN|nr:MULTISPECIES: glucose 1-dehydrogenase [Sphingobium]ALR22324.1 short-chain dehydrogenase [Sphingobium baderi]